MTPALRPFQLRDRGVADAAQRLVMGREGAGEVLAGGVAVVDRLDRAAFVFLDAAALLHPFDAGALEALLDVDDDVVVGVGTGGVVNGKRRFAGAFGEHDLADRHAEVGRGLGLRINLARGRHRAGGDLRRDEVGGGDRLVHGSSPAVQVQRPEQSGYSLGVGKVPVCGEKLLSLRRHDPDQVQRVTAVLAQRDLAASQPLARHPSEQELM